ncbi:MAG: ATP-binding protein [Pseudomonadota bacterium]
MRTAEGGEMADGGVSPDRDDVPVCQAFGDAQFRPLADVLCAERGIAAGFIAERGAAGPRLLAAAGVGAETALQVAAITADGWIVRSSTLPGAPGAVVGVRLARDMPVDTLLITRLDAIARLAAGQLLERAARQRAEADYARMLDAFEVLPDGFALYDAEDRLVHCNTRYRGLYELSAHAMRRGNRFEDILRAGLENGQYPEAVGREDDWLAERLAFHNADHVVVEQELHGGTWLQIVERQTREGGRAGLRVDITELKRQQEELEAARAKAEAANEAKSNFLAKVSHEIRTPMNGVIAMADALAGRVTDPEHLKLVKTIGDSGAILMNVINDLLDFSKIEAGYMTLEEVPFCFHAIARDLEATYTLRCNTRGVSLAVRVLPAEPALRRGDPHRVRQILHNLLSNAVKFTEQGEITATIDCRKARHVVIEVRDTGIGMSAEQAKRVYDDFVQADDSTTRRYGGTGLGLAIIRGLAEAMGGRITLDTHLGFGSSFRVTLPLPVVEGPASAAVLAAPAVAEVPRGLRILAADDNAVNRMILTALLSPHEADVTVTEDGAEAVARYQIGAHDLLMFDISMPEMDGVEALAAIRAAERAAGVQPVPAIAVTANAMAHQVEEYLAAGFDRHLAKPIRAADLKSCIASTLAHAP